MANVGGVLCRSLRCCPFYNFPVLRRQSLLRYLNNIEGRKSPVGVLVIANVKHSGAYHETAQHADNICKDREKRKHKHKRYYARKNQKFYRRYAERPERRNC